MSAEQRASDIRVLREIRATDDGEDARDVQEAFEGMLIRLEEGQGTLSPKQRKWVNDVARRLEIEPSIGPEDDEGPEPVRFTSGEIPRGKEVELNVGPLPLKPPGRR
jgi:hypothetical protein